VYVSLILIYYYHPYLYKDLHQFGNTKTSSRGSGNVARPFMSIKSNGELYEKTEKELEEIIEEHLELLD